MSRTPGALRTPAVTGEWIRGQLEFYAITYRTDMTDNQLADELEEAVHNGSVRTYELTFHNIS